MVREHPLETGRWLESYLFGTLQQYGVEEGTNILCKNKTVHLQVIFLTFSSPWPPSQPCEPQRTQ